MEAEFLTECGNFRIDAALPAQRVAIEVDGPWHFVRDSEGRPLPNGNTWIADKAAKTAGYFDGGANERPTMI